eukprot:15436518-Alexandrium_andersonii.AAC.1
MAGTLASPENQGVAAHLPGAPRKVLDIMWLLGTSGSLRANVVVWDDGVEGMPTGGDPDSGGGPAG